MNCDDDVVFTAGCWGLVCCVGQQKKAEVYVLKWSGGFLELKLSRSIWNVNNVHLLGKSGGALRTPSSHAFPPHCTPRRNTGEWQNTRWWHPGAIGCGGSVIGISITNALRQRPGESRSRPPREGLIWPVLGRDVIWFGVLERRLSFQIRYRVMTSFSVFFCNCTDIVMHPWSSLYRHTRNVMMMMMMRAQLHWYCNAPMVFFVQAH